MAEMVQKCFKPALLIITRVDNMPRKSTKAAASKQMKGNIFSGVSVDMLVLGAITSCVIVSFIGGFLFGALAAGFVAVP